MKRVIVCDNFISDIKKMKKKNPKEKQSSDLRKKAEMEVVPETIDVEKLSDEEVRTLAHELQVHQIELNMQNEELLKAQQELEESRDRYSDLYNFAPAGYFTISEKGLILEANLTSASMLGVERSLLIKRPLSKFIAKEGSGDYYRQRRKVCEENVHGVIEVKMRREDGSEFYAQLRCSAVDDENESSGQCRTIMIDISERKQVEEEIVKMQKLESISILTGGIAHDFNNVLAGIKSNIYLVKDYVDRNDKGYAYLTRAEDAVRLGKDLALKMLTFSKGGEPVKKILSAYDLITDSVRLAMSGSNVRCEFDIPDDLWQIEADEGQLIQVISNLMINASQAMPEGGTIKVRVENIESQAEKSGLLNKGKYVKITVKDQGIGIQGEHLQKIFDPYFTTKQKGSGLGLAIAYSIIRKHDGHITVESEMGVGTTFFIYLAASGKKITNGAEGTSAGSEEGKDAEGVAFITGKKVLFMDDDAIVGMVSVSGLEGIGYEVELVKNGTEAVDLYKQAIETGSAFDAVILDLTIQGGMGGVETIRELLVVDPNIKAIVASGYSDDRVMSKYKEYGFKGSVTKPYNANELNEALQKVLNDQDLLEKVQ